MSVLLGIDIGGTFTDIVTSDLDTGTVQFAKTPTFPADLVRSLREAMAAVDVEGNRVSVLRHGTTVVINAILTRSGGKTALITTTGFRDVLEIGRTNWPEPYNLFFDRLPVLVPRQLRFEVQERVAADGSIVAELDVTSLAGVIEQLKVEKVDAVAVCLLHSYVNPEHENQVGEALAAALPGVYVSLSHELSKEFREYERTSTAVTNAYVGGVVDQYIVDLENHLRGQGFDGTLYLMESNGGVTTAAVARRTPVVLVESGPAAGVMATAEISRTLGITRSVAFDMGGTTAKACLVEEGEPLFASQYNIPDYEHGFPVQVAALDIVEVGTGGGSIASVDDVGVLTVGPRSAGAVPGPACYGTGGNEPTVTDANLVLGRLNPHRFLGGEITLDVERAETSILTLTDRLGGDTATMAAGIIKLANFNMAAAIRRVSLERGRDPREFELFAYGGAGPLHALDLARELSIPRVVVPIMPGMFCALGMLLADIRQDFTLTFMEDLAHISVAKLGTAFVGLDSDSQVWEGSLGSQATDRRVLRFADCRYKGQEFTILVAVPDLDREDLLTEIRARFEIEYERRYGHAFPGLPVETVGLRTVVYVSLPKPKLDTLGSQSRLDQVDDATNRQVFFEGYGFVDTPVIERSSLSHGARLTGPVVVEEYGSTTLVGPADRVAVDELGQLVIDLGGQESTSAATRTTLVNS